VDLIGEKTGLLKRLGEEVDKGSEVHRETDYSLDVVPPVLYPQEWGWRSRAWSMVLPGLEHVALRVLEIHDLVLSKRCPTSPLLGSLACNSQRHRSYNAPVAQSRSIPALLPQRREETWQGGWFRAPFWVSRGKAGPERPWIPLWVSVTERFVTAGELHHERGPDEEILALLDEAFEERKLSARHGSNEKIAARIRRARRMVCNRGRPG
jgi:hypothetical protein